MPAQRIGEIVAGRRSITADTDLRLCRYFGLSAGYWLRAQAAHDTEVAQKRLAGELDGSAPGPARLREVVGGLSGERLEQNTRGSAMDGHAHARLGSLRRAGRTMGRTSNAAVAGRGVELWRSRSATSLVGRRQHVERGGDQVGLDERAAPLPCRRGSAIAAVLGANANPRCAGEVGAAQDLGTPSFLAGAG